MFDVAAFRADEVVVAAVSYLVLAAVSSEVGAGEESVVDQSVEGAVDRGAVQRSTGCLDRSFDDRRGQMLAVRGRENIPDDASLPRLPPRG